MSTFLELAVELRSECGIPGSGPAAVTGQTGELGDVVRWIERAYEYVQTKHTNWEFLREVFTFATIVGTANYTLAALSMDDDHGSWKLDERWRIYLTSGGTIGEQYLTYVPWDVFREAYLFGATRDQSGMPTDFTIKPDKSVQLWPKPNALYTIEGERFRAPDVLSGNTDEPIFPARFHRILVWQGLTYYGGKEESSSNYARGVAEADRIMGDLELDQLPPATLGPPLA